MRTITAILMTMFICTPAFAGMKRLPASNFEVLSVESTWISHGWLEVVTEIKNVGDVPGVPMIEITGRNESGHLLDTGKAMLMSGYNVPPGDTCAIKYPLTRNREVTKVVVKSIGGIHNF